MHKQLVISGVAFPDIIHNTLSDKFIYSIEEILQGASHCFCIPDFMIDQAVEYEETKDNAILINIASVASHLYFMNRDKKCEQTGWQELEEFSHYPLPMRIKLFLDMWERSANTIFIIEIILLMYKIHNK